MVKKVILTHIYLLATVIASHAGLEKQVSTNPYDLQPGDIVFQGGNDLQAKAVKAASHSRWSHVGLVFFYDGAPWVFEAVQPVKTTPLEKFIARCPSDFYAMRLKNASIYINSASILKAEHFGKKQLGKKYDPLFQWSNDQLYCSELVWKIYQQATGLQLCSPRQVGSYDLHHPAMQKLIKQRFGSMNNLPMDEPMVAPGDIARSSLLVEAPHKIQLSTRR